MSKAAKVEQIKVLTREEADVALREIAETENLIAARERQINERINALKARLVEDVGPAKKILKRLVRALEKWAGKEIPASDSKEGPRGVTLNFGRLWFRWTPPAIKFSAEEETVIARLEARGLNSCVRVEKSVNKEVLETLDDETLKAVGAYRDQEEKFYYEVKREEVK